MPPTPCAGVVTVIVVAVTFVTVAPAPPNVTLAPAAKPVPVIVTAAPPPTGPPLGFTAVTVTRSSMTIVPVPVPRAMIAFVGPLSATAKVSSASIFVSPLTGTVIVCVVTPGANVSVPLARW